jgi:HK97 gp10 family phage protein
MSKSSVTGGKQIAQRLRQLSRGLAVPINQASRRAMRPMLAAAKSLVPVEHGYLKKSLVIKNRKGTTLVGPRKDFEAGGRRPVRYAHLVEFGRAPNANGRGGMKGSRFLTRAFDATKDVVLKNFEAEIGPAIERRVQQLAAKGKK